MTLRVVDNPPDRPEWLRETIRLLVDATTVERDRLLGRVAAASEDDLARGSDDDWGLGQVATHLLIVERGVALIGLRLARGAPPGPTGQPRAAASAVSRAGIATLADKAAATAARLLAEFPPEPDAKGTARHPYYGDLNCFGWLLMLPTHYYAHMGKAHSGQEAPQGRRPEEHYAHMEALDRGRPSAL